MASLRSKRQQAKNEKILQELMKLAGNDRCADCGVKNPGWASWSLGIFLCLRCASLHRKLGTHISKVKSVSLDAWSNDQVEGMKAIGNIKSNAIWNPDPSKHPVPLNTEESDSLMERYLRDKYEYKKFRREVGRKVDTPSVRSGESTTFGISRPTGSSSSGTSSNGGSGISIMSNSSRSSATCRPIHAASKQAISRSSSPSSKIGQVLGVEPVHQNASILFPRTPTPQEAVISYEDELRRLKGMGFNDQRVNLQVLRGTGGNMQTTIEMLVGLNKAGLNSSSSGSPAPPAPEKNGVNGKSSNPFDEIKKQEEEQRHLQQQQQQQILQQQRQASFGGIAGVPSNPFGVIYPQQSLFPHRTGPETQSYNPFQSSVPVVPAIPPQLQQANPFGVSMGVLPAQLNANPLQPQVPLLSPYSLSAQTTPTGGQHNPFFSSQSFTQNTQLQPPLQSLPQHLTGPTPPVSLSFSLQQQQQQDQQQLLIQLQAPNIFNPSQDSSQFLTQQPQLSIQPQRTGLGKAGILSLYNYPQLAPTPPQQPPQQQQDPNVPQANLSKDGMQRSMSAPVAQQLAPGSNNPFLTTASQSQQQQRQSPVQQGQSVTVGRGHTAQESVDFGNWQSQSGRHSPDAFASLAFRQ